MRQHVINIHTGTENLAPSGVSLGLGEIAVQHTPNEPALWIKMGTSEESEVYEKFIGKTEIISLFEEAKILGSGYTYSGLPYVYSSTTIADAYSALTNELIKDERVASAALNDLNERVTVLEANSGTSEEIEELKEYVQENEEIVAGALNNLNARVGTIETQMTGDFIPLTGYELLSGHSEEELTITEEDTVNLAFGKIQRQILDDEEAIAAGFNDLNNRVGEVEEAISHNTGVTILSGAVQNLSAGTMALSSDMYLLSAGTVSLNSRTSSLSSATQSLSASVMSISAKTSGVLTLNLNGVEQGKYCPSANTTIKLEAIQDVTGADVLLTGYELASGSTEEELAIVATDTVNEAFGKLQKQNYDNEAVIAGALNDLDGRVKALAADSGATQDIEVLSGLVAENKTDITVLSAYSKTINERQDEIIRQANEAIISLDLRIDNVSGSVETISGCVIGLSAAVATNEDSIEFLSGSVETCVDGLAELSGVVVTNVGSIEYLSGYVEEVEYVAATALNDLDTRVLGLDDSMGALDDRVTALEANSGTTQDLLTLSGAVVTKEFVIAQAFNDLNARIQQLEDMITQLNSRLGQ